MKRLAPFLALAIVTVAGVVYARGPRRTSALYELVSARPERVFSPRLSIAVEYRGCNPLPGSAQNPVPREDCGPPGEIPIALGRLVKADGTLDPDSLRTAGLARVLWGIQTPEALNAAIDHLSRAARLGSNRVPVYVDLSALHYARAQQAQSPMDLLRALDYALWALELDPDNLLARFNAALALQAWGLDGQALRQWDRYLAADSRSPWGREARVRRDALARSMVQPRLPTASSSSAEVRAFAGRNPQRAREMGLDSLLGEWGRAVQQGKVARADTLLRFAELLGSPLEQRTPRRDASLTDAVRAIRAAHGNRAATHTLALAHDAYARGQARFQNDPLAALALFTRVVDLNPRSRALVGWARVSRAGALLRTGSGPEAVDTLQTLLLQLDSARQPAARARANWIRGQAVKASLSEASVHWQAAANVYARIGEGLNQAALVNQLSWEQYEKGDSLRAYGLAYQAMQALGPHRPHYKLHVQLLELGIWAVRDGMEHAAAAIQEEDLAMTRGLRERTPPLEALLARARLLAISGDQERIARDLDSAAVWIRQLPDTSQTRYLENVLRYSRGLAQARTNPPAALADLDIAVSRFGADEGAWRLLALLSRADIHLSRGDTAEARAGLDSISAQITRLSQEPRNFHLRDAMIEQLRTRFDRLVMLHVRAGQPLLALQTVERGRLSARPGADGRALSGWRAPPANQAVVEYVLIADTLLTWVIRRDSITLRERRVDHDSLLLAIEHTTAALASGEQAHRAQPYLRRLHDHLVAPVRDKLVARENLLVLVADGEIAGVPFEALRDAGGRYLVEDHPLRFALSLADAVQPPPPAAPANPSALLVANPRFDPDAYPGLRSLDGAVTEVDSLRGIYPRHQVLDGDAATPAALRDGVQGVGVLHYAGHALFDDARPERSFLVLAGRERLMADSLGPLDLSGTPLVVLSACRTLRARQSRSGGFAGLSGALLAAGAGGVVGSLWEADDGFTPPLMVAFHRAYRELGDPARALRQAQLQALRSPDAARRSPAAWAGFRYAGR